MELSLYFSFRQGPKQQSVDDSYKGNFSRIRVVRIPVSIICSVKNTVQC